MEKRACWSLCNLRASGLHLICISDLFVLLSNRGMEIGSCVDVPAFDFYLQTNPEVRFFFFFFLNEGKKRCLT